MAPLAEFSRLCYTCLHRDDPALSLEFNMLTTIPKRVVTSTLKVADSINDLQQLLAAARCDFIDRKSHSTLKGGLIGDVGARWGAKAATAWESGLQYILGRGIKPSDQVQLMTPKLALKQYGAPTLLVGYALNFLGNKLGVSPYSNVALGLFLGVMVGVRFLAIALPGVCLMGLAYGMATALHIACVTAYDASALIAKQGRLLRNKFGTPPGDAPSVSGPATSTV